MKSISWSEEKNDFLKTERGMSFELIEKSIAFGGLLGILPHTNPHYKNQKIFLVKIDNYVWKVPFVEDEEKIFLKTAYPSRKYKKLIS